jgi:hypothetical protein
MTNTSTPVMPAQADIHDFLSSNSALASCDVLTKS